MCHQRQPFAVCIATAALLSLLITLGCSSKSDSDETFTVSASAPTAVMGAAGSTFIAPLMGKWVGAYQQTHPKVQINYRPIGSGAGIEEMKQGYLSFGASDAPLTDDQAKQMSPVLQVPASAGPVCIVYNLLNLSVPLRLSAKSLSDIYLGNIISWQDPAIVRDNPGVKLPKAAVIVVHRSDGSGTTNIFTSYLAQVSHDWSWKSGHGLSVSWPTGLRAEGSSGLLAIVKQTAGAIGYLELNYAKENGVPVASIQNQAGHFVQPSPGSTAAAISAFSDALAKDVRTPIVDPPASATDAYPISGLSFILIRKDRSDPGEQQAIKDFIAFAISTGQNSAEELSYAKLPDSVQKTRTRATEPIDGERSATEIDTNGGDTQLRKGQRQCAPNHANHAPPEIRQTLEELYYRFREKFGRDPGPNDPIFFDPHSDQPAPLGREALNETWDRMADAMVRQGEITPETAYAMKKTGLHVTDQTKDLLSNAELGEWNDAVHEHRNVNATTRQADDAARLPVEDLHQFLPYQSRRPT